MCTAVVGGSIHRAATRVSAASDQRSTTPTRNHRMNNRRENFRCGAWDSESSAGLPSTCAGRSSACSFEGVSGFSVTPQNNRLPCFDIAPDYSCGLDGWTQHPARILLYLAAKFRECLKSMAGAATRIGKALSCNRNELPIVGIGLQR
jgi:hypothetical protein